MKVGYARVSTEDQNLDMQIDALKKASCARIYEERRSGKSLDRPELDNCRKALRAGDTLVVWRLDRLGRSLKDLVTVVNELKSQGIHFESLHEKIDTSTATGTLTFHLFSALAEFERNLIRERTREGLVAARARGRRGGRKAKLSPTQKKAIKSLISARELTMEEIAEQFGVSRATLYRLFP